MNVSEDTYKDTITYDDLKQVMDFHLDLVKNYTKTEWLNPAKDKHVIYDFITPLMEKYKIFGPILLKIVNGLHYKMDSEMIGSLNVLLAVTQKYGQTDELSKHHRFFNNTVNCLLDFTDESSQSKHSSKTCTDFYKDPNVEEVKSSYHVLEEIKLRIQELMKEWPEHPTLKTVVSVSSIRNPK